MFIILPVEWFADSSLQIFGRHQWLEDCFFVSFDAFLVVVFVHQDSLVVAFGGCKTRLKYQKYRVYFKEKLKFSEKDIRGIYYLVISQLPYLDEFAFLKILPDRLIDWGVYELGNVLLLACLKYFIVSTFSVHIKTSC